MRWEPASVEARARARAAPWAKAKARAMEVESARKSALGWEGPLVQDLAPGLALVLGQWWAREKAAKLAEGSGQD